MERLTEKVSGVWQTNYKANIGYIDTNESIYIGNAIDRLAEFEDFIEEQGFESFEQLKEIVEVYKKAKEFCFKLSARKSGKIYELMNNIIAIYKYRVYWQTLKEWVEKQYSNNLIEANDINSPFTALEYYGGRADSCKFILNKMQKLEKE